MFYNADMDGKHKTSMTELRKDLASYLRIANSGEQVVVTVDGKPFAALGPLEAQNEITIDHLVAGGLVNKPLRDQSLGCLLYTSPSPRDKRQSRMPSSA